MKKFLYLCLFGTALAGALPAGALETGIFAKDPSKFYKVGDSVTVKDPVLGTVTGKVTGVDGGGLFSSGSVTIDYGSSHTVFKTLKTGKIDLSSGQNYAHATDIPTITDVPTANVGGTYVFSGAEMDTITKWDGTEYEVKGTWTEVGDNQYTFTDDSGKMVPTERFFKSPENVAPKTTPASGANGTLPKVLPTDSLDMGFMRKAGINSFIENANGTVDLKMGSDLFGSSLTMDTKDFNAIFGKGGELPIKETNLGGGQSVLSLPNGSVLKEAQNGLLTDGKGNFFLESGGNAYPVNPNMSPAELQTVANQAKAKEALKAALVPSGIDKANVTNAFEYALQILEAVEGINQDDATKETTVKGVQSLQNSQGGSSDYSMGTDVSLEATTIASAAELMVELLKNNPMNLTYMDETKCAEYEEDTSTRRECQQEMKKISANATALSGVMIAEGSNAISSKFYDRIKNFTDINNNLGTGSLGAMSVINDAERYPYFEMVRGTALSAVQLGVKEMGTLTELDDLEKEAENAQ